MDETTNSGKKTIKYSYKDQDYPPYVYATNRQVDDRNYIIRTAEPRFIAEANLFDTDEEADLYCASETRLTVRQELKHKIIIITVLKFWDDPEIYDPKVIKAVTKNLAQWYKSHLISYKNYKKQNDAKSADSGHSSGS